MHKDIVRAAILSSGTKFLTITFKKKDGTLRRINGRFNALSKTVSGNGIDLKVTLENAKNPLIPFWSPKEGWKSFRFESILSVSALKTKIN